MAGTKAGAKKAAATMLDKYGADYYRNIGRISGSQCRPETRYFHKHPKVAQLAGVRGGKISKRGKAKKEVE